MRINAKKIVLFTIIWMIAPIMCVYADNAPDKFVYKNPNSTKTDNYVCFNRSTGDYASYSKSKCGKGKTYGYDSMKVIKSATENSASTTAYNNSLVYCSEWGKNISGTSYKKHAASKWNPTSKYAVVLGYAVKELESISDKKERYEKTGALINYYRVHNANFENKKCSTSRCYDFSKPASFISSTIKTAEQKYESEAKGNLKSGEVLGKGTLNSDGKTAKTSDTLSTKKSGSNVAYYYKALTIYGLSKTYGGADVSYKIDTNSDKVFLCENNKYTTNCEKTKIYSAKESITIYVKANSDVTGKITISVEGTNSSTYPTSYLYYNTKNSSSYQKLLYPGDITVTRTSSLKLNLSVPSNDYSISINKTDSSGNGITEGIEMTLYKVANSSTTTIATSTNGKIAWTGDAINPTDEFFVRETQVPSGFKKISSDIVIKEAGSTLSNSTACYIQRDNDEDLKISDTACTSSQLCFNSNSQSVDAKYCNEDQYATATVCYNTQEGTIVQDNSTCDSTSPNYGGENYQTRENVCVKNNQTIVDDTNFCASYTPKTCVNGNTEYCDVASYTVESSGKNINIDIHNNKNSVSISKTDATGEKEVPGAELKICKLDANGTVKDDCEPAKTIGDETLSWVSGSSPRVWNGLEAGQYAIIETIPAPGYKVPVSQTNTFKIDEEGNVTPLGKTLTQNNDGVLIIKNELNSLTISKTDIATSKELPGAKISICAVNDKDSTEDDNTSSSEETDSEETVTDEDEDDKVTIDNPLNLDINKETGECIPTVLADGTEATWTSGTSPKVISGLQAGTYALVEYTAPKGYSTAESILFKMSADGTLTDINGNSLANNKIVMKDAKISDVKTGMLTVIITSIICLSAIGIGSYTYLKKIDKSKKQANKNL